MVRAKGRLLLVSAIFAGLMVVGVVFYRSYVGANEDRRICKKVDKLTVALDQIISQGVQDEQLRSKWLTIIHNAACDPSKIKPLGG